MLRICLALIIVIMAAPLAAAAKPIGGGGQGSSAGGFSMPTDAQFGAKCDGSTDDTAALNAWLAAAENGARLAYAGTCVFTAPLTFPKVNFLTLEGAGTLVYRGVSTTNTLVVLGTANDTANNNCSIKGWSVRGLRIVSDTKMTAGDAVQMNDICQAYLGNLMIGSDLDDTTAHGTNFYNGLHIAGLNSVHLDGRNIFAASHFAHIVNGDPGRQTTDLYETGALMTHGVVGLVIGGNVGGFNLDDSDILLNSTEVSIDQSQVAQPNGSLFFGPKVAVDATTVGGTGQGIVISDSGILFNQGPGSLFIMTGTWVASAQKSVSVSDSGICVHITSSAVNWRVIWNGGTGFNCQLDTVKVDNASAGLTVVGTYIHQSGRYGINVTVPSNNLDLRPSWPSTGNFNYVSNLGGYATEHRGFLTSLGNLSGQLTAAQFGSTIQLSGNVILPSGLDANFGPGGTFYFYNSDPTTSRTITVGSTNDFIFYPPNGWGTTTRSITVGSGQTITLINRGQEWDPIGGSAILGSAVANSLSVNGVAGVATIDVTPGVTTVANGGTVNYANFGGEIRVLNYGTAGFCIFTLTGGTVTVTGVNGGCGGTFAYNSGIAGYTFTNTSGTAQFGFFAVRMRPTA